MAQGVCSPWAFSLYLFFARKKICQRPSGAFVWDGLNEGLDSPFVERRNMSYHIAQLRGKVVAAGVELRRNPDAVIGRIAFIVIQPVDAHVVCVTVRKRPLIEIARSIRSEPFITDRYATPPISSKVLIIRVITPLFHP